MITVRYVITDYRYIDDYNTDNVFMLEIGNNIELKVKDIINNTEIWINSNTFISKVNKCSVLNLIDNKFFIINDDIDKFVGVFRYNEECDDEKYISITFMRHLNGCSNIYGGRYIKLTDIDKLLKYISKVKVVNKDMLRLLNKLKSDNPAKYKLINSFCVSSMYGVLLGEVTSETKSLHFIYTYNRDWFKDENKIFKYVSDYVSKIIKTNNFDIFMDEDIFHFSNNGFLTIKFYSNLNVDEFNFNIIDFKDILSYHNLK